MSDNHKAEESEAAMDSEKKKDEESVSVEPVVEPELVIDPDIEETAEFTTSESADDADVTDSFEADFSDDSDDLDADFDDEEIDNFMEKKSKGKGKGLLVAAVVAIGVVGGVGYAVLQPSGPGGNALPGSPAAMATNEAPSDDMFATSDGGMGGEGVSADIAGMSDLPQPYVNQNEAATPETATEEMPSEMLMDVADVAAPAAAELEDIPDTRGEAADLAAGDNVLAAPENDDMLLAEPVEPVMDDVMEDMGAGEGDAEMAADLMPSSDVAEKESVPEVAVETVSDDIASSVTPSMDELQEAAHQDLISSIVSEAEPIETEAALPGAVAGVSAHTGSVKDLADDDKGGADTYYDSGLNVPQGKVEPVGPRKLDPSQEPASKFVISHKTHDKNDQESMLVSANRALKLQRYDAAAEMFDRLYEKNKRDPRILMGRAMALQNTGKTASAIGVYEELLELEPDNAPAMVNMLGLIRQQYPSVALRRLMDIQENHPDNAGIAAQIGVTLADLQEYDEALRSLGVAASIEPQNAQHPFNMAIVAERMGDKKKAIALYEEALELDAVYGNSRSVPRETIYDRLHVLRR
ncbi:MAG: tetratricopeptide repeat protein [Rhodospirillales bacterium]|nr:tetratricopeptide repeat protein [Rhodospirillales bacterium]